MKKFKRIIKNKLIREIKSDYCLLDIPDHQNLGDMLIYYGELKILSECIKFKNNYSCSISNFDDSKIGENDTILLHGGGNFGDIWEKHQIFREKIIKKHKKHKIIIMAQTVFFKDKIKLMRAIDIFSKHDNLVICSRDLEGFKFLKNNFKNNKIILIPDSALYLHFKKKKNFPKEILFLTRSDKESKNNIEINLEHTRSDWPSLNNKYLNNLLLKFIESYNFLALLFNFKKKLTIYDFKPLKSHIDDAISYFEKFGLIITDRVHAFILAYLIGIPAIILDNNYGKNKRFFHTWFKGEKNYYFAKSNKEISEILNKNSLLK